jgi:hypothetical protein
MYGGILLQLTTLFKEYNENVKPFEERKDSAKEERKAIIDKYGADTSQTEQWANQNKSFLLNPDDEWLQKNNDNI